METVFSHWENIPFTVNYIKQLHGEWLQYSDKDARHRGHYKTLSNSVETFSPERNSIGVIFDTASPFGTPRLMDELIEWTDNTLSKNLLHPLLVIAIFIVTFLEIHPFQDGNGRPG